MVVVGGDNDDTLIKVMDSSLETNNHSSSSSQVNIFRGKYFAERGRLCLGHFWGAPGQNFWFLVEKT